MITEGHQGDGLDEEDELSTSTADTEALEASIDWNPTKETNFSSQRDLWIQKVAPKTTPYTRTTILTFCMIAVIIAILLFCYWTEEMVQEATAREEARKKRREEKNLF